MKQSRVGITNYTMKQHPKEMKRIIKKIKVVIKSKKSWKHMVVNMIHNKSVQTFDDIVHFLELDV